jgi:hypothetical protein
MSPISCEFRQFSASFANFLRVSPIFGEFCQYFGEFSEFPASFANFQRVSPIFCEFRQFPAENGVSLQNQCYDQDFEKKKI